MSIEIKPYYSNRGTSLCYYWFISSPSKQKIDDLIKKYEILEAEDKEKDDIKKEVDILWNKHERLKKEILEKEGRENGRDRDSS